MTLKNKPTLKDVAARAGVSNAAASFAVNGMAGVGSEARQRILKAAKDLGYEPNQIARTMKTGKTDTVGLILPDLSNPYFVEIARAVEKAAREAGKCVFLMNINNDEQLMRESIARLGRHRVDGVIFCPLSRKGIGTAFGSDMPTVIINSSVKGYDCVMADYESGGVQIANLLHKNAAKRIGVINGPKGFLSADRKRKGLGAALAPKCKLVWEKEHSFAPPLALELIDFILKNPVDAIVAPNDLVAIELMKILQENNITVPDDVSIIGFNDISFAQIVSPQLTTVRQPIMSLGDEAFNLLMRRIQDRNAKYKKIIFDVELIERNSVANMR